MKNYWGKWKYPSFFRSISNSNLYDITISTNKYATLAMDDYDGDQRSQRQPMKEVNKVTEMSWG